MTISDLDAPRVDLVGRRAALRDVSASVAGVRQQIDGRLRMLDCSELVLTTDPPAGSAGARDLLLGSVGEGDNLLQRTLRTVGLAQQRSLADFLA